MMSESSFLIVDEKQDALWNAIVECGIEQPPTEIAVLNRAVMTWIDYCVANSAQKNTSLAIRDLEAALRLGKTNIYCVARRAHAPLFCSKNHSGQDCAYYLQMTNRIEKRNELFVKENCTDDSENQKRLLDCGLRIYDPVAQEQDHRAKNPHLYLPENLILAPDVREVHLDNDAILFYDSKFDIEKLHLFAKETAANNLSKALAGTGLVPMRTVVPVSKWISVRLSLVEQASKKQAFMQAQVIDSVIEQMIPLGFQVFGIVTDASFLNKNDCQEPHVVFDIYAAPLRRIHASITKEQLAEIKENPAGEKTRIMLAECANVDASEFDKIETWQQMQRNVYFNVKE